MILTVAPEILLNHTIQVGHPSGSLVQYLASTTLSGKRKPILMASFIRHKDIQIKNNLHQRLRGCFSSEIQI
jgi:hypothetical protein